MGKEAHDPGKTRQSRTAACAELMVMASALMSASAVLAETAFSNSFTRRLLSVMT